MGNDIRNINSVESMLDDLFDLTAETEKKMACCRCFIDNNKYIVAMDISDAPYLNLLIFSTEDGRYFILKTEEEWDDVVKKVCAFIACSDNSELSVSLYSSYWYSRLEPNSSIVTEAIEQNRKLFICGYPETFEDHYDPCDETGRNVLLITEFSDDYKQVHFYVHFEDTNEAFHLSEATDTPDLVWNLYCEFFDREEALQIKEREELNRFYPKNEYAVSDFRQIKNLFLNSVNGAFKSGIGIDTFRFRTDSGQFAAQTIAISSELNEVRVIIHNIDNNQSFSRPVSGRNYFEEIFAVDLFIELFPLEAHALYQEKIFDPKFEKIKKQITDILDKVQQGSSSSCSFYAVNKDIPALAEEYSADAVLEKDRKLVHLTVKCPYKKNLSYEQAVEVGKPYDEMLKNLYQFLYPNRISLSIEDIPSE